MSERKDDLLLEDIHEAIKRVIVYTKGMSYDDFLNDSKTIDAVVRNFQIIGEAANRISEEFKQEHSKVEWRHIIGLRNRIVHEYFRVDSAMLWEILKNNISELKNDINSLMTRQRKPARSIKRLSKNNAVFTPASNTTVLINYSFELKILEVEYTEERVYHYKDVEPETWERYKSWIESGQSSGQFVNKYIKPFYDAVPINV